LLPEGEGVRRAEANHLTIYELVRDPKLYHLPAYLDAADLALAADPANETRLVELLKHQDSGVRYWGAVGLVMGNHADAATREALRAALDDSCGEVAAMSAWALQKAGEPQAAEQALKNLLQRDAATKLYTLNTLDWMHADLSPYQDALKHLNSGKGDLGNYVQRMVLDLLKE